MVLARALSLISIVLTLGWMLYLLLGSLPLLILRYDDPSDSHLVRGMFDVHYKTLMILATIGAISSAIAARTILTVAFVGIVCVGFCARYSIVSRMDRLHATMHPAIPPAIRSFRRLHMSGLLLDLALMAGFFAALGMASTEMISCAPPPTGCTGPACIAQCSLV